MYWVNVRKKSQNILFRKFLTNIVSILNYHFKSLKRLTNGPTLFHACIPYINIVHACKKSGTLFKRLR